MSIKLLLFSSSNYHKNLINYNLLNYTDIFDEIKLLTENDLDDYIKNIINNIIEKYGNRGYGYWIWKPYLILQELNNMEDDDILVHLDCHCTLDKIKNNNKFNDIINYLINEHNKPLIICNGGNDDYRLTTTKLKNIVENYLNYNFSENEMLMGQYEAGIIFMKKHKFVINFFKKYFNIMINHIDAITDIYNNSNDNHKSFIENRHDQSVCSLLSKYYKINNFNLDWTDFH